MICVVEHEAELQVGIKFVPHAGQRTAPPTPERVAPAASGVDEGGRLLSRVERKTRRTADRP
jgi:hypothetical protein